MTKRPRLLRSLLVVALLALFLGACSPARPGLALAPSPESAHPLSTQPLEERLRAHVAYMASDACEGRLVGTDGDKMAASYVVDELKRIGASPLWKSGYLQEFEVSNQADIDARLELLGDNRSVARSFTYFIDFSEVLYPIWGMSLAEGKIAVVTPGAADFLLTEGSVVLARLASEDTQDLILSAMAAKCAAVLICDAGLPADALPLKYMNRVPADVPFPVFTVQPKCYSALAAKEGTVVRLTVLSQGIPAKQGWNVAGVLGNPSKQKTVVLCAHRDHMGTLADGTMFPGAIDNASGVSVVLEMARQLRDARLDLAVVFLFTDSEEVGLDGALYFAENLPFPEKNLSVVLNLDCVGVHSQDFMELNAGGGDAALVLADLVVAELSKEGIPAALTDEPLASDHQAFEAAGLPAVGLLSSVDSFIGHLHNASDTVDAVDPAKLAAITKALAKALTAGASN